MPISRSRKKTVYTPPPVRDEKKKKGPSPRWVPALMLALFVIGLLWLVVYYVATDAPVIGALQNWNLLVGFGFIIAGFAVSTQWR